MRQEMLTRSGAPDFLCLPFGWRIHFAMSFLPFLAFQPLLAKYECSMSEYMVSHVGDAFIFAFLYFHVVCFHVRRCLGTGWWSTSHGGCWPLPGVVPCFVFRFLYICLVVPAREGYVTFHVVYMLYPSK